MSIVTTGNSSNHSSQKNHSNHSRLESFLQLPPAMATQTLLNLSRLFPPFHRNYDCIRPLSLTWKTDITSCLIHHTCCNPTSLPEIHIWSDVPLVTRIQPRHFHSPLLPLPSIPALTDPSALSTVYDVFPYCQTCNTETLYLIAPPSLPPVQEIVIILQDSV